MDHGILEIRPVASFFPFVGDSPVSEDKQLRKRFQRNRVVIIERCFRQCVFEKAFGHSRSIVRRQRSKAELPLFVGKVSSVPPIMEIAPLPLRESRGRPAESPVRPLMVQWLSRES